MAIKVLFLCGTLEPAKSGVADFILALAGKLSSNGISCACLAIHDPFISATESHLVNRSTQAGIDILRISADHPWSLKAKLIKAQLYFLQP